MARYLTDNYAQTTMVVINFNDHLQPGTFEFALHHLIEEQVDTSVFDTDYNNENTGRLAYHPKLLLKIILYAYSKGITSSREMAWSCEKNVTFMALACQRTLHWTTLAHFVSAHPAAIKAVFEQVLLICEEQGLIGHDLIAIDGCKLASDASRQWSGTFSELKAKRDKIRVRIDWAMNEQHRLDEAGEEDRAERQAQTVATLTRAAERIEGFLETSGPRIGTGKDGREVKSNITDNESAKMKTSKGVIQGYTGIAAVDRKHQATYAASEFDFDPVTKRCHCPAGKQMRLRGEHKDSNGHLKLFFEGRLTDCRACEFKDRCLRHPQSPDTRHGHGRQVSFISQKRVSYTDWMRRRVDSDHGKAIYGHRMWVVEPVFGNLEHNKGLRRFSLRGKQKVTAQWQLYCMIQNIEKLQRYGQMAA